MNYKQWNWQTDYTGRLLILQAMQRAYRVAADRTFSLPERMAAWENAAVFKKAVENHLERN
jgi:hypothetical protein